MIHNGFYVIIIELLWKVVMYVNNFSSVYFFINLIF